MKKRSAILPFALAALVLELMPWGAVLNFAVQADDGSIDTIRSTFSYFSLTPFGYANFAPFVTALLTVVILILAAVYLFTGKCGKALIYLSGLAAVISLAPLLLGVRFFSLVGALITAALSGETVTAILLNKS